MRLGTRRTLLATLLLSIIGLLFGAQSANAAVTSLAPQSSGISKPFSASGCTQDNICIAVNGSGLTVNSIAGEVFANGGILNGRTWCGELTYTISNSDRTRTFYATISPHGCADAQNIFEFTEFPNASYPNNALACVGAQTDSGRPSPGGPACLTIHS